MEELLDSAIDGSLQDKFHLLNLLIETYDEAHNLFEELGPISLLGSFTSEHHLKAQNLVDLLGVSKGDVSDISKYIKELLKEVIR
ncbi:hypothetical protein LT679_00715 [Mucilaginibacter roseus]|uniref:Uncharacterized protein n=1 Tax=Mucilaginibacter roseus TaxID=1528868 RepID=A0ABS8TYQ9_9SPHI|nr:hypothetical protein [Mucilaginibacter roseus]MCD8739107.1 hypothetical protein [Mucilaginibacter roseus]